MATEETGRKFEPNAADLKAFEDVLLDKDMPVYLEDPDNLNYVPSEQHEEKEVPPMFYVPEHQYLGSSVQLPGHKGVEDHIAGKNSFALQNGLVVTYRGVNALAGDHFGLMTPNSRDTTSKDCIDRFQQRSYLLYEGEVGKLRAEAGLAKLKVFMATVDDATQHNPGAVHKAYQDHFLDIDALK